MKRKHLILLLVLAAAMLLLSGCGVPTGGVDVVTTDPSGPWQTFFVWPLAKGLIWLNDTLAGANLPYSWGFAIILFTLAIKVITFPLTVTQIKGMQAQKELQPRIQELQKKYGKDKEKLSQEQMKLYQQAGVNPLSGCLPMLVQMPVLFGLYSALISLGSKLESADFFWIPNLGFPHYTDGMNWIAQFFSAGEYTQLISYLILPALLMVSQFYMQKMTTASTPSSTEGMAGMMGQMSTIMTLMFGFFTLQVPAGLTLYWVTSNLLQMGQTVLVNNMNSGGVLKNMPALSTTGTSVVSLSTSSAKDADDESDDSAAQSTRKPTRRQRRRK